MPRNLATILLLNLAMLSLLITCSNLAQGGGTWPRPVCSLCLQPRPVQLQRWAEALAALLAAQATSPGMLMGSVGIMAISTRRRTTRRSHQLR